MEAERVTCSAGVPTVWLGLLRNDVRGAGVRFSSLERTIIGGSACSPAMLRMFKEDYGVEAIHGWGMTEMSPIGTLSKLSWEKIIRLTAEHEAAWWSRGHAIYGVDMKIVGKDGRDTCRAMASYLGICMCAGLW